MSAAILSRLLKISNLTTQRVLIRSTSSSSFLITPHYTSLDHHHVKWYHNDYPHDYSPCFYRVTFILKFPG
ncbi:hypothetical protein MKX03_001680, partial [Papaver bracteatum]